MSEQEERFYYAIGKRPTGERFILCGRCGFESVNANDVLNRFCARCDTWHELMIGAEDIWRRAEQRKDAAAVATPGGELVAQLRSLEDGALAGGAPELDQLRQFCFEHAGELARMALAPLEADARAADFRARGERNFRTAQQGLHGARFQRWIQLLAVERAATFILLAETELKAPAHEGGLALALLETLRSRGIAESARRARAHVSAELATLQAVPEPE